MRMIIASVLFIFLLSCSDVEIPPPYDPLENEKAPSSSSLEPEPPASSSSFSSSSSEPGLPLPSSSSSEPEPEPSSSSSEPINIPNSGRYATSLAFTLPDYIYCDKTGRMPTENSDLKPGSEITLTQTSILRCARIIGGTVRSQLMRTYILGSRVPNLPIVSIAVNPYDMFDNTNGLYSLGPNPGSPNGNPPYPNANYRKDTELPIYVDFFENGVSHAWSYPAGIRIMGNWSRSFAKKSVIITFREEYGQKNLRYPLIPEHPHLIKFKHFILRNNGNNFPNDYIRDMLMTSLTEGLKVDYQKGRAVVVYYNGDYHGIYNLRERSNSDYFETNYDIDEKYIDLVKAAGEVSQGSDDDYQDIINWLQNVTLNDANLKIFGERIDIDNFTNHHQCRVFYNDRDWPGNNMKRWRSNSPASKWKFFMYDTDHGFGSYGSTNSETRGQTMLQVVTATNGQSWPNPPWSTLILRKLLENESYKNAFINRFSLLIATYLKSARIEERINTLMAPIQSEIQYDQDKWGRKDESMGLSSIRNFGNSRPSQMQSEITSFFKLSAPVDITINGYTSVDGLPIPSFAGSSVTLKAYSGIPMVLKWNSGERTIDVGQTAERTFTAGL